MIYLIKTDIGWRLKIKGYRILSLQIIVVSLITITKVCDNNEIAKR